MLHFKIVSTGFEERQRFVQIYLTTSGSVPVMFFSVFYCSVDCQDTNGMGFVLLLLVYLWWAYFYRPIYYGLLLVSTFSLANLPWCAYAITTKNSSLVTRESGCGESAAYKWSLEVWQPQCLNWLPETASSDQNICSPERPRKSCGLFLPTKKLSLVTKVQRKSASNTLT